MSVQTKSGENRLPVSSSRVRQRLDAADQLAAFRRSSSGYCRRIGFPDTKPSPFASALAILVRVMLEPICHQNGLAVGRLYQIFQCIQLSAVNGNHRSGIVIHRTIRQLRKFVADGSSVGGGDLRVLHLQNQFGLELFIGFLLRVGQLYGIFVGKSVRACAGGQLLSSKP